MKQPEMTKHSYSGTTRLPKTAHIINKITFKTFPLYLPILDICYLQGIINLVYPNFKRQIKNISLMKTSLTYTL